METWRIIISVLMILSIIDITATYNYVKKYKEWQPNKPYNLIENNPMLVMLWNTMGLTIGTIVGEIIILSLLYIIGKSAHPIVIGIVLLLLLYAEYNHYINTNLLRELINKYPTGKLPTEVFGNVVGNN